MKIEKIFLQNFLSHESSEINFKGSINAIVGQNGAGKTSIIDGIVFSLFSESSRGNIKNLVKKGKSTGIVQTEIRDGNNLYLIKRDIVNSSNDFIAKNNIGIARGRKEVDRKIQEILKLDKDILLSTVIIRQGEIENIFKELPDVLKKILKIENLEKLTSSTGPLYSVQKEIESELKYLENRKIEYENKKIEKEKLEKEIEESKKKLEDLEIKKIEKEKEIKDNSAKFDELKRKRDRYLELTGRLYSLIERKKSVEKDVDNYDKIKSEKEKLEKEIEENSYLEGGESLLSELHELRKSEKSLKDQLNTLEKEIEEYEQNLAKKNSLEDDAKRYEELKERKEKIEEAYNEYNSLKSLLNDKLKRKEKIENEIKSLGSIPSLDNVNKEIDNIEKEIDNLQNSKGAIKGRKEQLIQIIKNLENIKENRCPVCGRELTEEHRKKIKIEAETEVKDIEKKLSDIEKKVEELRARKGELSNLRLEIISKLTKLRKLNEDLTRISQEVQDIQTKLKELEKSYNEYSEIREKLTLLEPKYKEYLKVSNYDERALEEKKNRLGLIKAELDDLQKRIKGLLEKIGDEREFEGKLKLYKENKNKLEKLKEEFIKIESEKNELEKISKEVTELEEEIRQLNFNEEEFENLNKKLEDLNNERIAIEKEISTIEGKINASRDLLINLNSELNKIMEDLNKIPKLQNAINKVEKLRKILSGSGLQNYIISIFKSRIENNLNDILNMFNLSFSRVTINFEIGGKTQKGKVVIKAYNTAGNDLDIESLSGGERISIALALRIAIAKSLMDEIGFMIMDEPTIHLDEERKKELLNVIKYSMNIIPQIIIVTHDDEIKEISDYIISVTKKGDKSIVKQGEYID
ncbi:Rad50, homologous recombination repair enzyme [Acidianus hospitalis W1]|uniref:DNA double-strand break repair Rad50 ATPase n=1 Tax=Acidianus hospitalis (strain W1) TaxID=933801 RepID=F4B9U7_ACIHW|nr:DNA double-strand break repair ATPase Rad50 [Acidianus hospitalis]AEE95163.1 Rad50, homologous recombination repair enzyme [Acidianus hospitalis W1]